MTFLRVSIIYREVHKVLYICPLVNTECISVEYTHRNQMAGCEVRVCLAFVDIIVSFLNWLCQS